MTISTSGRITPGSTIDVQEWPTLARPVTIPWPRAVTHIQFRRFAGCPICNLHLRSFVQRQEELTAAGVHEVVVFHSTFDELKKYESELPFDVVPDSSKKLYRAFGVEEGKRALLNPKVWWPIIHAVMRSAVRLLGGRPVPPIQPPGGRFGLPADFVVAADGRVIAARYGEHAYDQMSVDDVLQAVRRENGPSSERTTQ